MSIGRFKFLCEKAFKSEDIKNNITSRKLLAARNWKTSLQPAVDDFYDVVLYIVDIGKVLPFVLMTAQLNCPERSVHTRIVESVYRKKP